MATVEFIPCRRSQSGAGLSSLLAYCMREDKATLENMRLVSGVNCVPDAAYIDMMNTKLQFKKTDGKMYYHMVQSFSPSEKITPELAHQIAVEFAQQQFGEYEVVVSTHIDAEHIHSHFVWNSVSCEHGRKYHSGSENIQRLRDASDELCIKYGLSVVTPNAGREKEMSSGEYRCAERGENWKIKLEAVIEDCMRQARTKADFIRLMEYEGYDVLWSDDRKYITYITPTGMKCRDSKLYEKKFLKGMMEDEFRIREEIAAGAERSRPSADADDKSRDHSDVRRASQYDSRADREDTGADSNTESGDGEHRVTGWEDYRDYLKLSFSDGEPYGSAVQEVAPDLPDTFDDDFDLIGALASLQVDFSGNTYDEDPEERRRRIEAEQNARAFGELMEFATEIVDEYEQKKDNPFTMTGM